MISIFIGTWNMGQACGGTGVGEERPAPGRGLTARVPSTSRKCTALRNCDILVHIEGSGKTLDEVTVTIPHDIYVWDPGELRVTAGWTRSAGPQGAHGSGLPPGEGMLSCLPSPPHWLAPTA